jgi:hypothetical protein
MAHESRAYHDRRLGVPSAVALASSGVGSDSHEAGRVPHSAEEGQSEGTSGGDSRAGNGRFNS